MNKVTFYPKRNALPLNLVLRPPSARGMLHGEAMQHQPVTADPETAAYFNLVEETAYRKTGRHPRVLINPFTGDVFWVEGMHNCPKEMFLEIAESITPGQTVGSVLDALLN